MLLQILNNTAVRVTSKKEKGTGFLWPTHENEAYYCIFTAKHCIYGQDFNNCASISDVLLTFHSNVEIELNPETDKILSSNHSIDISLILIFKKGRDITFSLSPLRILPLKAIQFGQCCVFRGFSKVSNSEEAESFMGNINELTPENSEFKIKLDKNPESYDTSSEEVMKGFSGSGVLMEMEGYIYLVGIVQQYAYKFTNCKCRSLENIHDYIKGLDNFITLHCFDPKETPLSESINRMCNRFKVHGTTPEDCFEALRLLEHIKQSNSYEKHSAKYYYFNVETDKLITEINAYRGICLNSSSHEQKKKIIAMLEKWQNIWKEHSKYIG